MKGKFIAQNIITHSRFFIRSMSSSKKNIEELRNAYMQNPDYVKSWSREEIKSYMHLPETEHIYTPSKRKINNVIPVTNVSDIQEKIREATQKHTILRTIGSMHSID